MTDRDESPATDLGSALAALPRERQPDAALEERVVRSLLAANDIGPGAALHRPAAIDRRRWLWVAAAAAALVIAMVLSRGLVTRAMPRGDTYVLLLSQDSSYRAPADGNWDKRRMEYARWADSLDALGKMDVAGRLVGPGAVTGMFIVRAKSDDDAARIAATCPHIKYGGHIETRRLID